MNQDRYPFLSNQNNLHFEFESDGPNGKIRKVIKFTPENAGGVTYFSVGLGHINEQTGELDDLAVSNNQDRSKILATVASAILEFASRFPDMAIEAHGSTLSRTRLYQMGISANVAEIETLFEVQGLRNGTWERFQKNVNYDAFLVRGHQNY